MTSQIISILYVGDEADHQVLPALQKHDGHQWYLYPAHDAYEALATYILYYPHIIVLVGDSKLTRSVFMHIASVNATSPRAPEAVLVFAESVPGEIPATMLLRHSPFPGEERDVIEAISLLAEERAAAEAAIARTKRRLEMHEA